MTTLIKGRALVEALRVLKSGKAETEYEKNTLRSFPGFGQLALQVFPDPQTGEIKKGWEDIAAEVLELLDETSYSSARRTVFNAFYTAPNVMAAIYEAFKRFGVPENARVLEAGCAHGGFMGAAPEGYRFTGVEMDTVSAGIARLLYPQHDIRIENFRDTRMPEGAVSVAVGNVPFADISLDHHGQKLSLHDFFIAKSLDILAPGGILGVVTSRYTLDKVDSTAREIFQSKADLIGAIRLPNEAFKDQGTSVVTDIVFLRKRHADEADLAFDWRDLAETPEGRINAYFADHPEMVLGTPSVGQGQYGNETYKVAAFPDYPERLTRAVQSLQPGIFNARTTDSAEFRPAPPGLGEGTFYIEDGAIFQVECGAAEPVMFGQTQLREDGGLTGRRLAALIQVRDAARAVLKAQNEGRDLGEREATRRALNRSYDRFVAKFGPINLTNISEFERNGETITIRRMPNVAKFREDPDAVLVMSLEDYDEAHKTATKAAIMLRDVVGQTKTIDAVQTAEEGLLVSLNERGKVDLDHISNLYGKGHGEIVTELGDLLFHDPETSEHVTRELYLSGNVRRRLALAKASTEPRHRRNVVALEAVQPADLLPGEIDANLGAPWLPADDIRDFITELLDVPQDSVRVDHFPKDAVWSVSADGKAEGSVQNTSEFGTGRADALTLFEQALNMISPAIYDEIRTLEGTSRVLNQEQTFAAKEKQRIIKERFSSWIFTDHERAERLVRIYNDTFNNLVLPKYDGSHLTFPGMAETFKPHRHQIDATWRAMSSGNILLAHVVGAGKSGCMAMCAMKMRQTGLARKPLVCVPNHLLEQFGREFLQVYPNAKILMASKDDMSRDRRRLLTAKIASGDWDAIITTHSSFERIGMSRSFQQEFIREEIAAYATLLLEAREGDAPRNVLKHIEKRKASYEEKLQELMAEKKKDDGLVFDEIGVDVMAIDEFHAFKNLEVMTKMDRVAGIQTGGSQRAFDIFMKTKYLDQQTPGRGIIAATGTPISNSMVEMYTLMRYLSPRMLEDRGISHFDAWAASFGQVVESMEISPDGATLKPRSRFSKFVNLPELQTIFRSFADVQTADMLKLPVPRLKGGKAQIVSAPMSMEQRLVQAELVKRYERIRQGGVNPKDDNALSITTDGRKLALDLRLIEPSLANLDSKIALQIENVHRIWQQTTGTQMIFSDIGVNPTEWGFSVYREIIDALTDRGIPADQIANIGDYNTDAKKAGLFASMRAGRVRVLLGSTAKMGTGTNVQKKLYAVHHLDAPWKPAEIEQRDGRILRQGNDNPEVEIFRYVTEGSFDAFMWQSLETKAKFIAQIMKGDLGMRRADDIGGAELSFAEVKAIASGNPAVLTLAEMDADLQRLHLLQRSHADEQFRIRSNVKMIPIQIEELADRAARLAADMDMTKSTEIVVGTQPMERDGAIEAMNALLKNRLSNLTRQEQRFPVGTYRGFKLTVAAQADFVPELIVKGEITHTIDFRGIAAGRLFNSIDGMIEKLPFWIEEANEKRRTRATQLEAFKARVGLVFERGGELSRLKALRDELEQLLTGTDDRERMDEICAEYQAGKGKVVAVEQEPTLAEVFTVAVEEPVKGAPVLAAEPVTELIPEPPHAAPRGLTGEFEKAAKRAPEILPLFQHAALPAPIQTPASKRAARRSDPNQFAFQF